MSLTMGRKGQFAGFASPDNPNISSIHAGTAAKGRLVEIAQATQSSLSAVIMTFVSPHIRGSLQESLEAFDRHRRGEPK